MTPGIRDRRSGTVQSPYQDRRSPGDCAESIHTEVGTDTRMTPGIRDRRS
ncbi:unnamed protein product, partial [Staurois parvus]